MQGPTLVQKQHPGNFSTSKTLNEGINFNNPLEFKKQLLVFKRAVINEFMASSSRCFLRYFYLNIFVYRNKINFEELIKFIKHVGRKLQTIGTKING